MENKKYVFEDDVIFETDHFVVGQDWEVPICGFFIVATKRKIRSFMEFTDKESVEFMDVLRKVRKCMQKELDIDDVYMFQNEDTVHGFHLWMFPRLEWMEKFGRKIESVRPIMEYAEKNMMTGGQIEKVKRVAEGVRKALMK